MRATILLSLSLLTVASFATASGPSKAMCIQINKGYFKALARKDKGWFAAQLTDDFTQTFGKTVEGKKESVGDNHKTVEAIKKVISYSVTPVSFKSMGSSSVIVLRTHLHAIFTGAKGKSVDVDQVAKMRQVLVFNKGVKVKKAVFLEMKTLENGVPRKF